MLCGLAVATVTWFSVVAEPRSAGLALNTLLISGRVAIGALALGTPLAVLLARTNLPGRDWFVWAMAATLFLPLYVQVSAWDAGWGQQGWYTQWRADASRPWLSGPWAAVWIHTMAAIPWVVLIVSTGLRHVESDLEETALMDSSPWRVIWHVSLPRAGGFILAAGLLVGLSVAGEMTVTDVYRVRTYAEEIYTQLALTTNASEAVLGTGAQVGVIAALIASAGVLSVTFFSASEHTPLRRPLQFDLGAWRWAAAFLVALFFWVAWGIPVANLIYKAGFTVDVSAGAPVRTWTWQTLWESTLPRSYWPPSWEFYKPFRATAVIAAAVATLTLIIALPLAWLAQRSLLRAVPAMVVCAMGLALPGPMIGLGVIWLLNRPDPVFIWLYDRTIVPAVLAITVRTLPLAMVVLWHAFRSLGNDQVEVARTEGASWWSLLSRIAVPQILPALAVTWIGAFSLAAGDLAASILVNPPGMTTVSNEIFLLIHAGVHNKEAGLCLTQVFLFGLLAGIVVAIGRRGAWWGRDEP
jgi:iron(III) transport system permease protein